MNKKKKFLLVCILFTLALLVAWAESAGEVTVGWDLIRQLNRLFAVFGLWFFFLQFVLSWRIKFIEEGIGLDRMIRFHRILGRAAFGLLLLHPVFFYLYSGEASFDSVFRIIGIIVLIGLALTASVAALHKKLNLAYEIWLNIHKANYLLFPLVFIHVFHNAAVGSPLFYAWVLLGLAFTGIMVHKLLREKDIRRNPYQVVEVRQEAGDIWTLCFKGRSLVYRPGQFMYLRLVRDGKVSSSHPFTISSSPTGELLAVTPKEQGDFTATVKYTKPGDQALVDAPYGVFSFLNYNCEKIVFIAGGIGITPFISMLRYMYDKKSEIPVTLLWGNKDASSLCFMEELDLMSREMPKLQVVLVMSRQEGWHGEKGRIDRGLLAKYVPEPAGCDFFVCGPPAMSKAVILALRGLGVPAGRVHHELFEL